MSATAFQPEPSAKAPCTRTTFSIFCFTAILLCDNDSAMDHIRNEPDTLENTDHFCGFLLQMWSEGGRKTLTRRRYRIYRTTQRITGTVDLSKGSSCGCREVAFGYFDKNPA